MKVLLMMLFLFSGTSVLASLEPASYRSTTEQYLPPNFESDRRYNNNNKNYKKNNPQTSTLSTPRLYETPTTSTQVSVTSDSSIQPLNPTSSSSSSGYYYQPPKIPFQIRNENSTPSPTPANTYLPPLAPTTTTTTTTSSTPLSTSTEYLSAPDSKYLLPKRQELSITTTQSQYVSPRKTASIGKSSNNNDFISSNNRKEIKGIDQFNDNYLPPVSSAFRPDGSLFNDIVGLIKTTTPSEDEAKYGFEYRVSDEFGNDFSHKESQDGIQTQGFYSVLLPDGRKQIVHYQADESGFRPKISYEEAATILGPQTPDVTGYDNNANSLDTQGPY